jgi:hypothetical protein
MSLLRFILWSLVFYVIYKTVANIFKFFSAAPQSSSAPNVSSKPSKYNIGKEDVIEAHFEDIDSNKSEQPKENS